MSFAFVAIVRGQTDVWTMGMHVLGLRDVVMKRAEVESGGFDIVEVVRYLSRGENPVENGHLLGDLRRTAFSGDCGRRGESAGGKPAAQSLRPVAAA